MDLLLSFNAFVEKENLFSSGGKLLLAVSGGVDSVVLCELCHLAGFDFSIAHGNFGLRGEESDRDEAFVRQLATKYGKEVWVRRFETEQYAADKKVSIQVAARELRYGWFKEILSEGKASDPESVLPPAFNVLAGSGSASVPLSASNSPSAAATGSPALRYIVTAHHLDDNIETLLMNFFKGTGIAGLRAILPKQGNLVRPLLFAGKEDLVKFAREHSLDWVEDSSNTSDKYTRNYFRHQVIPLINGLVPGALHNLGENIARFREVEILYRQSVEQHKKKLLEVRGNEVHIPVVKLKKSEPLPSLVYEIIKEFGFLPSQVGEVINLLDSGSGKYIRSATHRILKNRSWLIISPNQGDPSAIILVESAEDKIYFDDAVLELEYLRDKDVEIEIQKLQNNVGALKSEIQQPEAPKSDSQQPEAQKSGAGIAQAKKGPANVKKRGASPVALLDAAAIQFPLLLRKWKQGDYFYPLGLKKKKKLGRFFIDNKLSQAEKEKTWVLEMNKKIVWVVGYRIDDRFRITPQTRQILMLKSGLT